jgi:hypothetical protein
VRGKGAAGWVQKALPVFSERSGVLEKPWAAAAACNGALVCRAGCPQQLSREIRFGSDGLSARLRSSGMGPEGVACVE